MYNVELFVIYVYCLISDDLYPSICQEVGPIRHGGFMPYLTDAECLTIEVVGQYLGYGRQEDLYEKMKDRFGYLFPALRDRVSFVRQSANLWRIKEMIWQHLVCRLGGHKAPLQIIDTMPMPICKLTRRYQRKIFRSEPSFDFPTATKGYCAAKGEEYFGFKGGIRMTDYGLIVHAYILKAYGHDATCRDDLLHGTLAGTTVVGDSAFLDLFWQQQTQANKAITILTPIKGNMKKTKERRPFILPKAGKKLRRLIETVGAQLTERFHIESIRVRDAWHLYNLFYTKILAHTICVFINISLNRKPLDFDGLVNFQ